MMTNNCSKFYSPVDGETASKVMWDSTTLFVSDNETEVISIVTMLRNYASVVQTREVVARHIEGYDKCIVVVGESSQGEIFPVHKFQDSEEKLKKKPKITSENVN
jgi:hypothetical protein